MKSEVVNSTEAPAPIGGYAQARLVSNATRWLYISGQIPVRPDGSIPDSPVEQCRQTWANVVAQLRAAGMDIPNLVKVTIFLSDRSLIPAYRESRIEVLGDHAPALTTIITGIFNSEWLLEIEAVAAD